MSRLEYLPSRHVFDIAAFPPNSHQSLASSSRSTSKVSTSKLSSTTQAAQRQQSTTTKPSPVYKRTSAAGHPFKPPSRVTQEEPQKAKAQLQSHRRKAPAIQHSSDEEEAPERVVRVRDGTKKTRDEEGGKQASRTGEASDERKYDIDICPYIPPADGVHVDSFLFT